MEQLTPSDQRRIVDFVDFLLECLECDKVPEGWNVEWQGRVANDEHKLDIKFPSLKGFYKYLKDTKDSFRDNGAELAEEYARTVLGKCISNLEKLKIADNTRLHPGRGSIRFTLRFSSKSRDLIIADLRRKLQSLQGVEEKQQSADGKQSRKACTVPNNLPPTGAYNWFVGRSELLEEIHHFFNSEDEQKRLPRVILHGMPGVGKSEISKQYAMKYAETYKGGMVFVDARGDEEHEDRVVFDEMLHIAQQLTSFITSSVDESLKNDAERLTPFEFLRRFWTRWPSSPEPVLIILDDLVNYSSADWTLDQILPPQYLNRFKVLITSRKRFTPSLKHIDVDKLTQFDAYEMLTRILGENDSRLQLERPTAYHIIDFLEYLPLGIELTGRYLFSFPSITLTQALTELQQRKLRAEELLKSKPGLVLDTLKKWWRPGKANERDRDMTSAWGVYAALQLTWESLKINSRLFAYILSLYAPHPIPDMSALYRIFRESCRPDDEFHDIAVAEAEFKKMKEKDFIKGNLVKRRGVCLDIHQLVREFFIAKFEERLASDSKPEDATHWYKDLSRGQVVDVLKDFCARTTLNLYEHTLAVGYQQKGMAEIYVPHVIEAVRLSKDRPELLSPSERALRLLSISNYYYEEGSSYSTSLSFLKEAVLTLARALVTEENLGYQESVHVVYTSLQWIRNRVVLMQASLPEHIQDIGEVARLIVEFNSLYERKLKERKIYIFSTEKLEDVDRRFLIASFTDTLGDPPEVAEALEMYIRLEESSGGNVVERVSADGNSIFEEQPLSAESLASRSSISCIRLIAQSRNQTLPYGHPKQIATLLNLAKCLRNKGASHQDTIQVYEDVLILIRSSFPDKLHLIGDVIKDLATYTFHSKVYDRAEVYYKQLLDMHEVLPQNSLPDKVEIHLKLAEIYEAQSRYDVAINTLLKILNSTPDTYLQEHPAFLPFVHEKLANCYLLAGQLENFEKYSKQQNFLAERKQFRFELDQLLKGRWEFIRHKEQLGQWQAEEHELYQHFTNTHQETEALHNLVYSINANCNLFVALGENSVRCVEYTPFPHRLDEENMQLFGSVNWTRLIDWINRVLNERRNIHGTQSIRYFSSLYRAAQIFSLAGSSEEALTLYEEMVPLASFFYQDNYRLMVILKKNAAEIAFKLQDYEKALSYAQSYVGFQAAFLSSSVWNAYETLIMIARCFLALNREDEALMPLKFALAMGVDRRCIWNAEVREPLHLLTDTLYKINRVDEALSLRKDLELGVITDSFSENDNSRFQYQVCRVLSDKFESDRQYEDALKYINSAFDYSVLEEENEINDLRERKKKILYRLGRIEEARFLLRTANQPDQSTRSGIKKSSNQQYYLYNDVDFISANQHFQVGAFNLCKSTLERIYEKLFVVRISENGEPEFEAGRNIFLDHQHKLLIRSILQFNIGLTVFQDKLYGDASKIFSDLLLNSNCLDAEDLNSTNFRQLISVARDFSNIATAIQQDISECVSDILNFMVKSIKEQIDNGVLVEGEEKMVKIEFLCKERLSPLLSNNPNGLSTEETINWLLSLLELIEEITEEVLLDCFYLAFSVRVMCFVIADDRESAINILNTRMRLQREAEVLDAENKADDKLKVLHQFMSLNSLYG